MLTREKNQEYPVSFDLQVHQTLLQSKSITFKPTSSHCGSVDWTGVTLEDHIRIIGKKEVKTPRFTLVSLVLFLKNS